MFFAILCHNKENPAYRKESPAAQAGREDARMQKILGPMRAAVEKYHMIGEGDRIAVGVSGGKDSLVLLCALAALREFYPSRFEVAALTADPQFHGEPADYSQIEELCRRLGVPYHIRRTQLGRIIFEDRKEANPCSLCARMRRGILHNMAKEAGCNKLALGHHYDDAVETFFMNLFNSGSLDCFSPKSYLSRKELWLIRPLVFCGERQVAAAASRCQLPVVKSSCPADGSTSRQRTKELIARLEKDYPDLKSKVMGAVERAGIAHWDAV
ncbi:tRNA 2-thiocytidine(32) synthetase TtcA [[Clostridium] leptum]|nr:tRNA 2-thiocytidine(32) synthetase TtcA [[Clostridium] leptum]